MLGITQQVKKNVEQPHHESLEDLAFDIEPKATRKGRKCGKVIISWN